MIIGRDLMLHLGLTVDFKRQVLQWDGTTVNMKESRNLLGQSDLTKREMREVVMQTAEPASTWEATDIMVKIIYITYAKADLEQVVNDIQMNAEERNLLPSLLEDFEDLFYGTLGDWDTEPVDLELNPDSKPFNSRYYLVPRINKEIFWKQLKRLVEIGVPTPVKQSQYSTTVFIIPKKEGTVRFVTDYHRLNQKLVRNSYNLTRIGETIQQLEGFQYVTVLHINMVYYNIRISTASQYMTTIVTEFGKFIYNRLPIGICAYGDIFQAKVDEILGDIEGVKKYIDDIIVLGKDIFENPIEQLRIIFGTMRAAGLKVNAHKWSFGLKEIPYLGYVIKREGIKPDSKKL